MLAESLTAVIQAVFTGPQKNPRNIDGPGKMPKFAAHIQLDTHEVWSSDFISGKVTLSSSKKCVVQGVQLKLMCTMEEKLDRAPSLEKRAIEIAMFFRDGTLFLDDGNLTLAQNNRPEILKFKEKLPSDLIPSFSESGLSVTYKLEVSSRRSFNRRKEDATCLVTVLPSLDLRMEQFSQVAKKEVKVREAFLGGGSDLLASATVPKYGWEPGDAITVRTKVTDFVPSAVLSHIAYLERIINFKGKTITNDVAKSTRSNVTWNQAALGAPHDTRCRLLIDIPIDSLVTGVMYNDAITIRFRIRVEISPHDQHPLEHKSNEQKCCSLYLPILIGASPPSEPADQSWGRPSQSLSGSRSRRRSPARQSSQPGYSRSYSQESDSRERQLSRSLTELNDLLRPVSAFVRDMHTSLSREGSRKERTRSSLNRTRSHHSSSSSDSEEFFVRSSSYTSLGRVSSRASAGRPSSRVSAERYPSRTSMERPVSRTSIERPGSRASVGRQPSPMTVSTTQVTSGWSIYQGTQARAPAQRTPANRQPSSTGESTSPAMPRPRFLQRLVIANASSGGATTSATSDDD